MKRFLTVWIALAGWLVVLPAHALTEETLRMSTFASAGAGDTNWYASALNKIVADGAGYLAVGSVEVQEETQGQRVAGSDIYIYRLDAAFAPVDTFGTAGKLKLALPAGNIYRLPDMVRLASGQFVVVAESSSISSGQEQIAVARFTANGELDTTFDGDGVLFLTMSNVSPSIAQTPKILVMSDGRLVVTGSTRGVDGIRVGFVARLSANGVQETSFGNSGYLLILPSPGSWLTEAALDGEGRLVVAGSITKAEGGGTYGGIRDIYVARITLGTAPALDTTFNTTGHRVLTVYANDSWPNALAVDGSGIVVGFARGDSMTGAPDSAGGVARLTASGELDAGFGSAGVATVNPGDAFATSKILDILPITGGYVLVGALDDRRSVVLLNSAGALDTGNAVMGSTGYWRTAVSNESIFTDGLISNGKLVAVGLSLSASGTATSTPSVLEESSFLMSVFAAPAPAAGSSDGGGGGGGGGGSAGGMALLLLTLLGARRRVQHGR